MKNNCSLFLSTLGAVGRLPKGGGTVATILTLPVAWLLRHIFSPSLYIVITIASIIFSIGCINRSLRYFSNHDPIDIVLDEVVGTLVALTFTPLLLSWFMLSVAIFRFLDITKCLGIKYVERIPGVVGIVMDDIFAALLTIIIIYCLNGLVCAL